MSEELPTFAPDDPVSIECYSDAIQALKRGRVEFLVGGAYSFSRYSGIYRHTKDLYLFLRPDDLAAAKAALDPAFAGGTLLGKRYVDKDGTVELLCVKAGQGALAIDGVALQTKDAKPLPSSD